MHKPPTAPLHLTTPSVCAFCGRWPTAPVCQDCWTYACTKGPRCPRCASRAWVSGSRCTDCWPEDSALAATWAAVDYAYPWSNLIARFKFRGEVGWAPWLAQVMLETPGAALHCEGVDWLVPMPMRPERLAERGHHPAWLLTQALRKALPNANPPPILAEGLVRLEHGHHQHDLPRAQRLLNPSLACVTHPRYASRWLGAHVLLIDDVCTTGASLQAAAGALRLAGAAQVGAWVLARTPPHQP